MVNYFKQIFLVLIVLLLAGCAAAPKNLSNKDLSEIKRVMLVVDQKNDTLKVLDHTGASGKSYSGGQFGAIGGLIDGILITSEISSKTKASLGGDPQPLIDMVGDCGIKPLIEKKLEEELSNVFDIEVYRASSNDTEKTDDTKHKNQKKICLDDCFDKARSQSADAVLYFNISHGLAVYENTPSSVVVDATVTIFDVSSRKKIMEDVKSSDLEFCQSRHVDDFMNDTELYKQDLNKAINGFVKMIKAVFKPIS
ncbi:MAG: hypothetical protein ABII88_09745 [Candidatus Omnitrophota bacterium]